MFRSFHTEIQRIAILLTVCVALGLLIGQLSWLLALGAIAYTSWMLLKIRQLERWLENQDNYFPPDASGIWGDIFDRMFKLQRKQEKEKRRLKAVINRVQETTSALRDGVVVLDPKGNINWWNRAAQRLLGLQSNDQGHPLVNFVRNPDFIGYFEKGDYTDPLNLASPNFDNKHLQFQITVFGQSEYLVVIRDITQIHNLEQMRQDFVGNVSHELRTPLTVIRGYLETLCDTDDINHIWPKASEQMLQQTERMSLLINDLITLSKLETESLDNNHQPLQLASLFKIINNDAQALNTQKQHNISIHCPENLYINGNEEELHSAFLNLVTNAIKYCPDNSKIDVLIDQSSSGLNITVKDNGKGFERKHISRLTERFYRIDASRNSSTGGTGLGLAIVKHILLRHDAKLTIDSQEGKGSSFTCTFPVSRIDNDELKRA